MTHSINIPEALRGQAQGIWQRLLNVPNPEIKGSGVAVPLPYRWPDPTTVEYYMGDETLTLYGIHLGDYGKVNWARETETSLQLLDEIEVPQGVPWTKTYEKSTTEKTSLLEGTKTALIAGFKEVIGQEYGTGLTLDQRIESDYEKQFGQDHGETESDTFSIGPITDPGKYRIYSYSFERVVSSRPIFDYHIRWSKDSTVQDDVAGPGNEIVYWKRAEWEDLDSFLDFISGDAPDSVGMLHSGRIVHGQYSSSTTNPDHPLAPYYRERRQLPDRFNPVPPVQQTVRYGQGTRIERL